MSCNIYRTIVDEIHVINKMILPVFFVTWQYVDFVWLFWIQLLKERTILIVLWRILAWTISPSRTSPTSQASASSPPRLSVAAMTSRAVTSPSRALISIVHSLINQLRSRRYRMRVAWALPPQELVQGGGCWARISSSLHSASASVKMEEQACVMTTGFYSDRTSALLFVRCYFNSNSRN